MTPPLPDSGVIVADGDFIGAISDAYRSLDQQCLSQPGSDVTVAAWIGHAYRGLEQSFLVRVGLAPEVKQHGPTLGFSSLAGPWGKALRVGEPAIMRSDNNPFTGVRRGRCRTIQCRRQSSDADPGEAPVQRKVIRPHEQALDDRRWTTGVGRQALDGKRWTAGVGLAGHQSLDRDRTAAMSGFARLNHCERWSVAGVGQ